MSRLIKQISLFSRNPIIVLHSKPSFSIRTTGSLYSTSAGTYKAVVCKKLGRPLKIEQLPSQPTPDNMVKVSVKSAGLNYADLLICIGKYQERYLPPFTPGLEVCGSVKEVGKEVTDFKAGDRVIGITKKGGFGEECIIPTQSLWRIPDDMSDDVGASLSVSYGTAWLTLAKRTPIAKGDTVVITAAAGAFGLAAVDLAANVYEAKVIAACSSEKMDAVRAIGATHIIDYNNEKLSDRIKEITNKKGADLVVDAVGGQVFQDCLKSLSFGGRIAVIGFASGDLPSIPAHVLLGQNLSAVGVFYGAYATKDLSTFIQAVDETITLWNEKKLNPTVGKTFDVEKITDAMTYLRSRKSIGKVVIKI